MVKLRCLAFALAIASLTAAHGDHTFSGSLTWPNGAVRPTDFPFGKGKGKDNWPEGAAKGSEGPTHTQNVEANPTDITEANERRAAHKGEGGWWPEGAAKGSHWPSWSHSRHGKWPGATGGAGKKYKGTGGPGGGYASPTDGLGPQETGDTQTQGGDDEETTVVEEVTVQATATEAVQARGFVTVMRRARAV